MGRITLWYLTKTVQLTKAKSAGYHKPHYCNAVHCYYHNLHKVFSTSSLWWHVGHKLLWRHYLSPSYIYQQSFIYIYITILIYSMLSLCQAHLRDWNWLNLWILNNCEVKEIWLWALDNKQWHCKAFCNVLWQNPKIL